MGPTMRFSPKQLSITVIILLVFCSMATAGAGEPAADKKAGVVPKIEWLTYDQGLARAKQDNKPIIIDFTASWCGWCKKMERETFSDSGVINYVLSHYVPVKVWGDDTTKAGMVTHQGERMRQSALTQVYNVRGFPTFWFLDSQGGKIGPVVGYKTKDQFLPLIEYVGGGHYKTMSYDSFITKRSGRG